MPLSSSDIAQMNGGYQQMAMGQMQYAGMIGRYGMQQGQSQYGQPADMMMGRAMNAGMAVGAPVATMGMGMMGLDAMSMGMAGASMGWKAGGLMGAVGGGMAAAAIPMAATAAVSYGASQMMEGAHQQQLINQTMRTNFNQIGQYGRGFQRQEMTQIGQQMRGMTHEFGAGGEITTMNELTNLAGKMGQMGGGRGIQDVQEFGRRFKELVSTVKTVAQELGTSLESAQNMMQGLKGSGVFSKGNQMSAFKMAKGAALGGNLAMEEVMGMGNMGSQIARSIGGRGRAGFTAGVKTAGMVGGALETGVLSEEDIYNATGQVGAEGREALGASLMSVNASFLRSSRGRRVMASMAGENGSLNADDAEAYMSSGGFGVGGTMGRARKNANRSRAGFLRNEGKMRGEVMALDPLVGVRQTMTWLEERGFDMNSDIGRIALQRQMKAGGANVGEEQLDAMVKLVQKGDIIGDNQKSRLAQDKTMQDIGNMQKTTGMAGLKTKLEHARESVQGKLQQIGAEFMNSGAEQIERAINQLSDQYVQTYSRIADDAFRQGAKGSSAGASRFKDAIGATRHAGEASAGQFREELFGGQRRKDDFSAFAASGDKERYEKAGYTMRSMSDVSRAEAMSQGARNRDPSWFQAGAELREEIQNAYLNGDFAGKGDKRLYATHAFLRGKDSTGKERRLGTGQDIGADLGMMGSNMAQSDADRAKQASQSSSLLEGAGVRSNGFDLPESRRGLTGNLGHTAAERAELFGLATMKPAPTEVKPLRWRKRAGGGMEPIVEAGAGESWVADKEKARAVGQWMESDTGKKALFGMMSTDKTTSTRAATENRERLLELVGGEDGDPSKLKGAEKDEFDARTIAGDAQEVGRMMEDDKNITLEEASAKVAEKKGGGRTAERVAAAYKGITGGMAEQGFGESRKMARTLRGEGQAAQDDMRKRGLITMNDDGSVGLSAATKEDLKNFGKDSTGKVNLGDHAGKMLEAMVTAENIKTTLSMAPGNDAFNQGQMIKSMEASASVSGMMDQLSTAQKREMETKLRNTGGKGQGLADALGRAARVEDRYTKAANRYGAAAGAGAILGVEMSDEERRNLSKADPASQAQTLLAARGIDVTKGDGSQMLTDLTNTLHGEKWVDGKVVGKMSNEEKASRLKDISGRADAQAKENQGKEKEKDSKALADAIGNAVGVKMGEIFGKPIRVIDESKGGGNGNPVKTPGQ
jgi:hypothetical protein